MKKVILFCVILLFLVSCSEKAEQCEGEECAAKTETPCGDGICDQAEQQSSELCPADCTGDKTIMQKQLPPESTESFLDLPEALTFIPDEGVRMYNASNPGAKVNDDGSVTLIFERKGKGRYIATAEDGLLFGQEEKTTEEKMHQMWSMQMTDGTWRSFGFNPTTGSTGCLGSYSSGDGITFTQDEGCRYELQDFDNGRMGTYSTYVDDTGGVILVYVGDMMGTNSVRRAYSTDNGWTFDYTGKNITGDEASPYGTYVDEKLISFEDKIVLIGMRRGILYALVSEDNAVSFTRYTDVLLSQSDYASVGNVVSLHDPVIVELPDGRLRIYAAVGIAPENISGQITDDLKSWAIVSATTQ